MKRTFLTMGFSIIMGLLIGIAWMPGTAAAEKPVWAGGGKDHRQDQYSQDQKNAVSQGQKNARPQDQKNYQSQDQRPRHPQDQKNFQSQDQRPRHPQDQKNFRPEADKGPRYSREKHAQKNRHHGESYHGYFSKIDRSPADRYYAERFKAGKCPPGLAKKGHGCTPPGHDRRWRMNKPLPREVIFHDLPHEVAVELGAPPPGYRFVRVAQDILMITVGTGVVIDAIQDIGRQMGQ